MPYAALHFLNKLQLSNTQLFRLLSLPLNQDMMLQPAVMNVEEILLWRRRTRLIRRADGITVCLLCLKNTAGEAPSQTSQLHGRGLISDLSRSLSPSRYTKTSFQICAQLSVSRYNTERTLQSSSCFMYPECSY